MTNIEHPHQEESCEICSLISLIDNVIRPVIEFETRKKIAKEIESKYIMTSFNSYEEGYDDGLKRAVEVIRGSND